MTTSQSAKLAAEIEMLRATTLKLQAEARKLNREYGLAPMAVGAAMMAAATGFAVAVLKLFGI